MTSRELVHATLEFRNTGRAPRQLWHLPWAEHHYPEELVRIQREFPGDFGGPDIRYRERPKTSGSPTEAGVYVDEWNCTFHNLQRGVIGEVKEPLIPADDLEWKNAGQVHLPEEWLTFDLDAVNRSCAASDKFMMAAAAPIPSSGSSISGEPKISTWISCSPPRGCWRSSAGFTTSTAACWSSGAEPTWTP